MTARDDIEARAARWVLRREEPGWSAADQKALDAWLAESMAHKAAYWRLEHGWRQADRIGALGDVPQIGPNRRRSVSAGTWRVAAIAASILLVFFAVGYQVLAPRWTPEVQTVATPLGGRKLVALDDGSRIELNTQTRLRTAVTATDRQVWLDQGEAYFEVKHSETVPFVVHAGPRTVTVLGTKFVVRRNGDDVTVSVVEGRVRVSEARRDDAAASSSVLVTGDVAVANGPAILIAKKPETAIESALAWRTGMLSFDRSSLAEVAGEFNRYNARKLVIADPEVAKMRIGGTFQASNVDAFARLLHSAYGLQVEESGANVKISR